MNPSKAAVVRDLLAHHFPDAEDEILVEEDTADGSDQTYLVVVTSRSVVDASKRYGAFLDDLMSKPADFTRDLTIAVQYRDSK